MIGPINNLKSHVITQLGRNESWNSSVYQRYHFHIFQIPSIIIISINAIKVIRVNAHGVAEKDHTKLLPNTAGFSQKLVSIQALGMIYNKTSIMRSKYLKWRQRATIYRAGVFALITSTLLFAPNMHEAAGEYIWWFIGVLFHYRLLQSVNCLVS